MNKKILKKIFLIILVIGILGVICCKQYVLSVFKTKKVIVLGSSITLGEGISKPWVNQIFDVVYNKSINGEGMRTEQNGICRGNIF